MVLTTDEMDEVIQGFNVYEPASGPYPNEEAIEDDFDPEDERADVEKYGRVGGHQAGYPSPGEEPTRVVIRLDLFDSAGGASGYLGDAFEDLGRSQELGELDIRDVGDEALGFISRFPGPDSILIGFRFEQILGLIAVHNVGEGKSQDAEALARRLAEKIEAVTKG